MGKRKAEMVKSDIVGYYPRSKLPFCGIPIYLPSTWDLDICESSWEILWKCLVKSGNQDTFTDLDITMRASFMFRF